MNHIDIQNKMSAVRNIIMSKVYYKRETADRRRIMADKEFYMAISALDPDLHLLTEDEIQSAWIAADLALRNAQTKRRE